MDTEEYRAASLEQWRRSAEGWGQNVDHVDSTGAGVASALVERTAPAEGETVLELACGPGGVGLLAAPHVGNSGRVILSDFAEPMVEVARSRAGGAPNVEARVLDAEAIDLPDACADVVLCRMGLMLMPRPALAAREMARVLRPGGRLGVAVWGEAEANPWLRLPISTLMNHFGAPPPEPGTPGVFALADRDELRAVIEGAGFGAVEIEEVSAAQQYESFDAWWDITRQLARPFGDTTDAVDESAREAIRESMRRGAAEFTDSSGAISMPGMALVATAKAEA